MDYDKPWLSVDAQVAHLVQLGLEIRDLEHAKKVLEAIGYYRLTGYLYPFRRSETMCEENGRALVRVLSEFRPGTTLGDAERIIDFDRRLRLLVLDGIERIEIAVRMRIGHVLGRRSAFAYEDPACFMESFTADTTDIRCPAASRHAQWLVRVHERQAGRTSGLLSTSARGTTTGCQCGH